MHIKSRRHFDRSIDILPEKKNVYASCYWSSKSCSLVQDRARPMIAFLGSFELCHNIFT